MFHPGFVIVLMLLSEWFILTNGLFLRFLSFGSKKQSQPIWKPMFHTCAELYDSYDSCMDYAILTTVQPYMRFILSILIGFALN